MSQIEYISFSGAGRRDQNEDRYLAQYIDECCHLFIVCDGMGGMRHGARAAELALQATRIHLMSNILAEKDRFFFERLLKNTERTFSAFIKEHSEYEGMGTTLALLLLQDKKAHIMWIGDSRIYHIRGHKILFQTEDQNMATLLLRNNLIKEDSLEYRYKKNILINCIMGAQRPADLAYEVIDTARQGDYFIIATDGFTDAIHNGDIAEALSHDDLEVAGNHLKNICQRKSEDNYTFILARAGGK